MAQFSRIKVVEEMERTGFVPLFYHGDIDVATKVLKACFDGGATVIEFTNRGDFAHEVFREMSKYALEHCPGLILGVGSVTDAASASYYMSIGANFIVTPVFRKDIAIVCNRRKVAWFPGCGSLTEITIAEEMGCEVVKLFPGGIYGPGMVKAVKAPQPWTKVMPTGGVTTEESNLKAWFDAGVTCVGLGSKLISKQVLQEGRFEELREKVSATRKFIQSIR